MELSITSQIAVLLAKGSGELLLELDLPRWYCSFATWKICDVKVGDRHLLIERCGEFHFRAELKRGAFTRSALERLACLDKRARFWLRFGFTDSRFVFAVSSSRRFVDGVGATRVLYQRKTLKRTPLADRYNAAQRLQSRLGASWLDTQLSKISSSRGARKKRAHEVEQNTLASWLYTVQCEQARSTSELVLVSDLSMAIDELEQANVVGLAPRCMELRSEDNRKVLSTAHEILTAAELLSLGPTPEFIPERNTEKTPDILFAGMEVECKRKSPVSDRDIKNRNIWSVATQKIGLLLDKAAGSWLVEFWTRDAPTMELLTELLRKIGSSVDSGGIVLGSLAEEYFLRVTKWNMPTVQNDGVSGQMPTYAITADEEITEVMARFKDGRLAEPSHLTFAYGTAVVSDWIIGTVKTISDTSSQFSGQKPAVVVVEIPTSKLQERTLRNLMDETQRAVVKSKTISAVVLIVDVRLPLGDRTRHRLIFRNPNATRPVDMGIDLGTQFESLPSS